MTHDELRAAADEADSILTAPTNTARDHRLLMDGPRLLSVLVPAARTAADLVDLIDVDELRAIGDRLRELDPYWREAESRKRLLDRIADAAAAARGEQ